VPFPLDSIASGKIPAVPREEPKKKAPPGKAER